MLIIGEWHLSSVPTGYTDGYNGHRPHPRSQNSTCEPHKAGRTHLTGYGLAARYSPLRAASVVRRIVPTHA